MDPRLNFKLATTLLQFKADVEPLKRLIDATPEILSKADDKGNTLLHLATKAGYTDAIAWIILKLNTLHKLGEIARIPNHIGNTPLHYAVFYNNFSLMCALINAQPISSRHAARICNDAGWLPIDCVAKGTVAEKTDMYKTLLPYTMFNPHKKLSDRIEKDDIKVNFKDFPKDHPIHARVGICIEAMKNTRAALKQSDTHPDANELSTKEIIELQKKIDSARALDNLISVRFRRYQEGDKVLFISPLELKERSEIARNNGVGNCSEFSFVMFDELVNRYGLRGEIFCFPENRGDHVFLIIGRRPGSNPNDPSTWGDEAFICDPWSGNIFPASQIREKLGAYWSASSPITNTKNLVVRAITYFNPVFHGEKMNVFRTLEAPTQTPA